MSATPFQFPIVDALIARHAEDAAFYWSQLDRAINSPQVGFDRLQHFNRLIQAHLDGLVVAGPGGWQSAMSALERWKKSGEAFVGTWLGARSADAQQLDQLLPLISSHPEQLLRGVISALAWLPRTCSIPVLQRWSAPGATPVAKVAAVRAAALMGGMTASMLTSPLQTYLCSDHRYVRAAACRAAVGANDGLTSATQLEHMLSDPDLAVRAEAAMALAKLGQCGPARPVLLQSIKEQILIHGAATGWERMQSARRLQRWVGTLAWLTQPGASEVNEVLQLLPPRSALMFVLRHGDPVCLPFVVEQMGDPEFSRYAGWVWQTLTGIDLAKTGWTMPEPDPSTPQQHQAISDARQDADNGLPLPDQATLRGFTGANSLAHPGERILLGRASNVAYAIELLETAPQAIRFLAARMANQGQSAVRISVRAPAARQRAALASLRALAAEEWTA